MAYAPTNHLAIMSNIMWANGGQIEENNWGRGRYFEGGVGYFIVPYKQELILELFAGYGVGNQHHVYGTEIKATGTSDLKFDKYFIQPAAGIAYNNWEIALSVRFNKIHFRDINHRINPESNNYDYNMVESISQNRTSYLYEPALTIRGGWKYVKIQFQYVGSENRSHSDLDFEKGNISLGLYFTIANRYDNERKKDLE